MKLYPELQKEFSTVIDDDVQFGSDCYVGHFTHIRYGNVIGHNTEIRAHCFIAPKCNIGNLVKIMQYSNIGEGSVIEDQVFIGLRVTLINTRIIKHTRDISLIKNAPVVRYGARIGTGAIIFPGVEIGRNACIGVGAVVTHDVPEEEVWYGNPAKFIKKVDETELI